VPDRRLALEPVAVRLPCANCSTTPRPHRCPRAGVGVDVTLLLDRLPRAQAQRAQVGNGLAGRYPLRDEVRRQHHATRCPCQGGRAVRYAASARRNVLILSCNATPYPQCVTGRRGRGGRRRGGHAGGRGPTEGDDAGVAVTATAEEATEAGKLAHGMGKRWWKGVHGRPIVIPLWASCSSATAWKRCHAACERLDPLLRPRGPIGRQHWVSPLPPRRQPNP